MSVEVKDFRKFREGKMAQEALERAIPAPLLEQEEAKVDLTGHPELDKLVRVIQFNIEQATEHLDKMSHMIVVQIDPNMKQKMTLEYMLAKGMLEAYKAIQLLPAQILKEQSPIHTV